MDADKKAQLKKAQAQVRAVYDDGMADIAINYIIINTAHSYKLRFIPVGDGKSQRGRNNGALGGVGTAQTDSHIRSWLAGEHDGKCVCVTLFGGHGPSRLFTGTGCDFGILEGIGITLGLAHPLGLYVDMRLGHEELAVLQPAGHVVEIELSLVGLKEITAPMGTNVAFKKNPTGRLIIADEIGPELIVAQG